jgi:hypothetical protein
MLHALAVAALALVPAATAAPPTADRAAQMETIMDMRDAGTVLGAWLTQEKSIPSSGEGDKLNVVDWSSCPAISYEELAQLVANVSGYEGYRFRRFDSWGNPFEYCLQRGNLDATRYRFGVRSAGKGRQLEVGSYEVKPFPTAELERDIVWLDGVFVTWPQD